MSSQLHRAALFIGVGGTAAVIAHRYFYPEKVGLLSALVVLFTVSWFIYRFTGPELVWNTFSMLKNPPIMALIAFLAAFTYHSFYGNPFNQASVFALGAAFLGAALGMWLFKYWTIGD
jgi:hypothetical protein